jgi:hypothetical protein
MFYHLIKHFIFIDNFKIILILVKFIYLIRNIYFIQDFKQDLTF